MVLDSDIDFSGGLSQKFEPIGKDLTNHFTGTFDGQRHIIRNLTIVTSSNYAGLFGYSEGVTIRNLVIDSSCSFTSAVKPNNTYIGGLIRKVLYQQRALRFLRNNVNTGKCHP